MDFKRKSLVCSSENGLNLIVLLCMVPFHSELFFSLQASSADCMASDEQTDRQTESQAICPTIWSVCACAKRVRRRKKRRVFSVWSSEAVVVAATEARRLDLQATLQQSNSVTVWTADYCLSHLLTRATVMSFSASQRQ